MVKVTIVLCCFCFANISGADARSVDSTRAQSAQVEIDNDRIVASDVTLQSGTSEALDKHDRDFVTLYLTSGKFRLTDARGSSSIVMHRSGDATFTAGGSLKAIRLISHQPARIYLIDLKRYSTEQAVNRSKYPDAFPRPGSTKLLENDQIVVWRNVWLPGVVTPMHYHSREAVVLYLQDGALTSRSPDGSATVANYKRGMVKFFKADRTHSEQLASSQESAIIVELK
jgi:quercetin dioxygenase-like cupin family protein